MGKRSADLLNQLGQLFEQRSSDIPQDIRDLAEQILRQGDSLEATRSLVQQAVHDALGLSSAQYWEPWVRDLFDDTVVYEWDGKTWQRPYTITDEDGERSVTLGDASQVEVAYVPAASEDTEVTEAKKKRGRKVGENAQEITGDCIPLSEKALSRDGTAEICLIKPGWGSSGYYSEEVLKRDAPVFAGAQMFWDHPGTFEESDRPERSLRDLAAVIVGTPTFKEGNGKAAGVYGRAKVFEHFQGPLEEIAEHIGVSIRGIGEVHQGEAEGRTGNIVDQIVEAHSVDFVTKAGAGGQVLQLFESARKQPSSGQEEDMELKEALERLQKLEEARQEDQKLIARQGEALLLRDARDFVTARLAAVDIPNVTRSRLAEQLAKAAPTKEGQLDTEQFQKDIDEAVKAEVEYLKGAGISGGRVTGLGETSSEPNIEELDARIEQGFKTFGLSETAAKVAVAGRN